MTTFMIIMLLVIGLIAIFLEAFVPAGGILGLAGFVCMVISIINAFAVSQAFGFVMLLTAIIFGPAVLILAFHLFPRTYVGKMLILNKAQSHETGYSSYTPENYVDLTGKEGVSVTMLRPSGMAQIGGQKYNVVTEGDLVQNGTKIRVVRVEGSRIVVRRVAEQHQEQADQSSTG